MIGCCWRDASCATFSLGAAPGGISSGSVTGNNYSTSLGTLNALGIGTPTVTGVSLQQRTNGALYFSPYLIILSGLTAGHTAKVTAYVSTNYSHTAALVNYTCPSTSNCSLGTSYSAMSISSTAQTTVVASMGNGTVTAGFGIFLPDNDGPSAFTGMDSSIFTLTMRDNSNNSLIGTFTISLNNPPEIVQNAVRLTLGTATGGLTINTASDFSMDFGNVNGLGIAPATGLTTVAATGGVIYSTPYLLNAAFSNISSTKATLLVYVSTQFAHNNVLELRHATASSGPYSAISTSSTSKTQITTTAADRSATTRYLGLFVSNLNGSSAFTGTDTSVLTFTMTVP
jgi:hypothetical protein